MTNHEKGGQQTDELPTVIDLASRRKQKEEKETLREAEKEDQEEVENPDEEEEEDDWYERERAEELRFREKLKETGEYIDPPLIDDDGEEHYYQQGYDVAQADIQERRELREKSRLFFEEAERKEKGEEQNNNLVSYITINLAKTRLKEWIQEEYDDEKRLQYKIALAHLEKYKEPETLKRKIEKAAEFEPGVIMETKEDLIKVDEDTQAAITLWREIDERKKEDQRIKRTKPEEKTRDLPKELQPKKPWWKKFFRK